MRQKLDQIKSSLLKDYQESRITEGGTLNERLKRVIMKILIEFLYPIHEKGLEFFRKNLIKQKKMRLTKNQIDLVPKIYDLLVYNYLPGLVSFDHFLNDITILPELGEEVSRIEAEVNTTLEPLLRKVFVGGSKREKDSALDRYRAFVNRIGEIFKDIKRVMDISKLPEQNPELGSFLKNIKVSLHHELAHKDFFTFDEMIKALKRRDISDFFDLVDEYKESIENFQKDKNLSMISDINFLKIIWTKFIKELFPKIREIFIFSYPDVYKNIDLIKNADRLFLEMVNFYKNIHWFLTHYGFRITEKRVLENMDRIKKGFKSLTEKIKERQEKIQKHKALLLKRAEKQRTAFRQIVPPILQSIEFQIDDLTQKQQKPKKKITKKTISVPSVLPVAGGGGQGRPTIVQTQEQQTPIFQQQQQIQKTKNLPEISISRFKHVDRTTSQSSAQQIQRSKLLQNIKLENQQHIYKQIDQKKIIPLIFEDAIKRKADVIFLVDVSNVFYRTRGGYSKIQQLNNDLFQQIKTDAGSVISGWKRPFWVFINQGNYHPEKGYVQIVKKCSTGILLEIACLYQGSDCYKKPDTPNPLDDLTLLILEKGLFDMKREVEKNQEQQHGKYLNLKQRLRVLSLNPFLLLDDSTRQRFQRISSNLELLQPTPLPQIIRVTQDLYRDFQRV